METVEIKLYKFSELSDEAKQKAIEKLSDINVDYEWWESIYEDAENIGLKINGFNIDRGSYCKGEFINSAQDVAEKIIQEHGQMCETYSTTQCYLSDCISLNEKYKDAGEDDYDYECELDELKNNFLNSLLEDYRIMLSQEYDYSTSDESIIQTIEANDYDFTEDGKLY